MNFLYTIYKKKEHINYLFLVAVNLKLHTIEAPSKHSAHTVRYEFEMSLEGRVSGRNII